MAGNYMDAPASRVAYDRDGSIGVFISNTGLLAQLSAANLRTLNGEAETGVAMSSQRRVAIIFPAPRDIAAVFFATNTNSRTWTLETSVDTTTGIDGTWITHQTGMQRSSDVKPNYRIYDNLSLTTPGDPSQSIRGVRLTATADNTDTIRALHIYADMASAATLDRLAFWDPVSDVEVSPAHFDWGNVPRGSSADRSFRIKNMSEDLTAEDIAVFFEALTPGSPSVAAMHTISDNGGSTFLTNISIAELAPEEISDVLIVRRVVPTNAQVSVWSARIAADVTTWTN